ncbi:peptidylprolyl isomerase [Shewanella schlegeliana]|uniref:peptidylprolyl isomerase n=1 Tax=Shewanella schlegeliana TaxID=190308 RepID=A0ABS1T1Q0_9GAMM|nr:peptidylprolyl isomerase [Shewanella schlegeliana]MBL4914722.1 peptidylprolyl isomerase [Shewanella schlegeliana]MCL1109946.1 peptidylprolyl isomerase [Shewanella schlegeliana]GIU25532.1 peptidylprolyl isomerase [Shewanella schlegeliana]
MGSCGQHASATPSEQALPVISVNGVTIKEEALANELQYHSNSNFDVVVQQAGQTLVIRQLLIEQAKQNGVDVTAENEEQAIQQLLADKVVYQEPSEEDCLRYFQNNREKFVTAPLLEVDHILLPAPADDEDAREVARQNAENILVQLSQDISDFAELAKKYSACPSKETGGSLGQISSGQTVPEFEQQLMQHGEGLVEQPLTSRYGFHVVNIARKVDGKQLDYNMVADKVKGYLVHRASRLAIQAYIHGLVEVAEIEGIDVGFAPELNIHL